MAGQFRANLRLALRAIRMSKGRSLLTLTGVVIGVGAFIVVVAIGEGIKQQVNNQIDQLGKNVITIRSGQINPGHSLFGLPSGVSEAGSLDSSDVDLIQRTQGVEYAVPISFIADTPSVNGKPYNLGSVIATSGDFNKLLKQKVQYGAFLDTSASVDSAVLSPSASQAMFNSTSPLGDSFSLLGQQFVVTGVMNQLDTSPLSINSNFNNAIFIRYSTAQNITKAHLPLYEILVAPKDGVNVESLASEINQSLEKAHGQHNFSVLTQAQALSATTNILDLITKLVIGVASIALLVGGVGIMDIMLVSVTERMSEVGLRKAVGASNRQILDQFVVEALVLSAVGAIIGSLVALIVCYMTFLFTDVVPKLTWQSFVLADLVAILVGLIFGTFPALKASRKDPITALRSE